VKPPLHAANAANGVSAARLAEYENPQLRTKSIVPRSRIDELWAKIRSKVVKVGDFTQLLKTLRSLHNNSLVYIHSYNGFHNPSRAVEFVIQHSKKRNFAPFWMDAHCLSEDEARQLQRAFGFHSKTFSLLHNHMHGNDALKYEREVSARRLCALYMNAFDRKCQEL
jgi:hypothetical protein